MTSEYNSSAFVLESAGSSDLSSIESAQETLQSLSQGAQPPRYSQVPSFYTQLQPQQIQSQQQQQQMQQGRQVKSFLGPPKTETHKQTREQEGREQEQFRSDFNRIARSILESKKPLDLEMEQETVTVAGETGIWANKADLSTWRSPLNLKEYPINEDPAPEIVKKISDQIVTYRQEFAIRYLKPPTPQPSGELIIEEDQPTPTPPAPDLVIRQTPPRPQTPEPIIVREAPPRPPPVLPRKVVRVAAKRMPPPPRRVIIERLPQLPKKPPPIIIERWMAYKEPQRPVVFKPAVPLYPERPRNVVIQWDPAKSRVIQEVRDMGLFRVDPAAYMNTYRDSLVRFDDLPQFVKEMVPPKDIFLASGQSYEQRSPQLTGDLDALSLIDLEREGLGEYKHLQKRSAYETRETETGGQQQPESVKPSVLTPAKPIEQPRAEEAQRPEKREAQAFQTQEARRPEQTAQTAYAGHGEQLRQPEAQREQEKGLETPQKEPAQQTAFRPPEQKTQLLGKSSMPNLPSRWDIEEQLSHMHAQMRLGQGLKPVETGQAAEHAQQQPEATQQPQKRAQEQQQQEKAPEQAAQRSEEKEEQQHRITEPTLHERSSIVNQVFSSASRNDDNTLSLDEAKRLLRDLNERLNRRTDEHKCQRFLDDLKKTPNGSIDYENFKSAVIKAIYA